MVASLSSSSLERFERTCHFCGMVPFFIAIFVCSYGLMKMLFDFFFHGIKDRARF